MMDTSCTVRAMSPSCSHRSVLVGRTGKGPLDPRLVGSSFNLGAFFFVLCLLCFALLPVFPFGFLWRLMPPVHCSDCFPSKFSVAFFQRPHASPLVPQTLMSTKRRPPLPNTTAKLGFVVPCNVGKLMTLAVPIRNSQRT